MKPEIKSTVTVLEYLKTVSAQSLLKSSLTAMIQILSEVFGVRILIETPFKKAGPTFLDIEYIISELQRMEIVDHVEINRHKYHDEPFQFTADALPHGFGHDFFDARASLKKALGEAVERYLWKETDEYYQDVEVISSYAKLYLKKMDIFSIAGFTKNQKSTHEKLQFTEDTVFSWIPTLSLTENKKVYCPTSLISAKYTSSSSEPMLRWNITTGQATHETLEQARLKAILEIIERDAFMISYLNKLTPPKINLSKVAYIDKKIAEVVKKCHRYNIEVHSLLLPTDFPVSVILTILVDKTETGPSITVGACCDFDIHRCILHSISESLSVRTLVREKLHKNIDLTTMKREERLVYWGKQGKKMLNFFLENNPEAVFPVRNTQKLSTQDQLKILLKSFQKKEYNLYCIETTPKKLQRLNFRSVSVVSPQMQPMHLDESIPYFGGKRIFEVPKKLGYIPAHTLNTEPHPFP